MSSRALRKSNSQHHLLEKVLYLGYAGQRFHSISLRQLATEMDLVPSALYRYFPNKNALANELLDEIALLIKSYLGLLAQIFYDSHCDGAHINKNIQALCHHLEQKGIYWHFFITERWGGSIYLEHKIQQEITFLSVDLSKQMQKKQPDSLTLSHEHATILTQLLLPTYFSWMMQYFDLIKQPNNAATIQRKQQLCHALNLQLQWLRQGLIS
ncbi:MAG: TetR/AcrR family transcriptional regulator [Acinetobacter sp.]